jgi:serine/threonine protein kinase
MADDPTAVPPTSDDGNLSDRLLAKLKISIPGYQLLSEISRGGQAIVYKAIQESTGKTVAVKLLREGPLADKTSRQRLQREAGVLAALDHPNIVAIKDRGQTPDGHDFLVMNFIAGRVLDQFIMDATSADEEVRDPSSLLRLFMKICDAVNAAHLRGVTHRDLSPSNIIVDECGEPHVLDFGLARTAFDRFITRRDESISVTGQFLGKLAYASPEQAQGNPDKIDIRTDVYALGVILYQILTGGRFPYEVVGNIADVLNNIIHAKPTPPSKLVIANEAEDVAERRKIKRRHPPVINETIEAIVLKALEKNPDDRYQSAGELAREIGNYLSGRPTVRARGKFGRGSWKVRAAVVALMAVAVIVRVTVTFKRKVVPGSVGSPESTQSASLQTLPPETSLPTPLLPKLAEASLPALGRGALVTQPAAIPGVRAWTIETIRPRSRMAAIRFASDNSYVAISSWDGAVRLYNARTGELEHILLGSNATRMYDLVTSADGQLIAARAEDGLAMVWNARTGKRMGFYPDESGFGRMTNLSPDGGVWRAIVASLA